MLFSLILLGLSAAVIHGAPTLTGRGSYSVPAIRKEGFVRNGTASMLKAYAKHNLHSTRPDSILPGSSKVKRQDGSVSANPTSGDEEYLCPVSIGGQTLNLDFDTGSADLWVFSTELPSGDQSGHNVYDPSESSTYQELSGYSWSIQYADGSGASGTVGTDVVTIGQTTVESQAVELADQASDTFVSGQADGLVGLAFSSINTVQPEQQNTFFANAASSLDSAIVAAYLPSQASGAYDFGFTDSSKFSGSIKYTSVDNSNGFWEFPSTSYKVGSTTYSASGTTGIADTGTTLILMSDSAVDNYYAAVGGASFDNSQGGYVFDCDASLPSLSVKIGSTNYATVAGSFLNFGSTGSGNTCFGGLQSVGSGSMNIYGDVFFNANYAVFDLGNTRFGFATAA